MVAPTGLPLLSSCYPVGRCGNNRVAGLNRPHLPSQSPTNPRVPLGLRAGCLRLLIPVEFLVPDLRRATDDIALKIDFDFVSASDFRETTRHVDMLGLIAVGSIMPDVISIIACHGLDHTFLLHQRGAGPLQPAKPGGTQPCSLEAHGRHIAVRASFPPDFATPTPALAMRFAANFCNDVESTPGPSSLVPLVSPASSS